MTRAQAAAGFAVEIFVEQDQVSPVRIASVFVDLAVTRSRAVFVRQKDAGQSPGKLLRHFFERGHVSRASRALDLERFPVEEVITLERLDNEEVDREPDRATPVRVAAEEITVSLARDIIDTVFFVARAEDVWVVTMDA
jgi:hypothetical protein